jgi:hypothetical protein
MERTFSGGIFSDELDDGRAGADIELLPSGVCACSTEGEAFVIPFRDCQIEIGGFSGRMVFCRNADRSVTIFCEDREFPSALSLASWGTLDSQLGETQTASRGVATRADDWYGGRDRDSGADGGWLRWYSCRGASRCESVANERGPSMSWEETERTILRFWRTRYDTPIHARSTHGTQRE